MRRWKLTAAVMFVVGALAGPFFGEAGKDGYQSAKNFALHYAARIKAHFVSTDAAATDKAGTPSFLPAAYAAYLSERRVAGFNNSGYGWVDTGYYKIFEPSYDFYPYDSPRRKRSSFMGGSWSVTSGPGDTGRCSATLRFSDSCWTPSEAKGKRREYADDGRGYDYSVIDSRVADRSESYDAYFDRSKRKRSTNESSTESYVGYIPERSLNAPSADSYTGYIPPS